MAEYGETRTLRKPYSTKGLMRSGPLRSTPFREGLLTAKIEDCGDVSLIVEVAVPSYEY